MITPLYAPRVDADNIIGRDVDTVVVRSEVVVVTASTGQPGVLASAGVPRIDWCRCPVGVRCVADRFELGCSE